MECSLILVNIFFTYLSSILSGFMLAVTSQSFTVLSADPEASTVPSQLREMKTEMPPYFTVCDICFRRKEHLRIIDYQQHDASHNNYMCFEAFQVI